MKKIARITFLMCLLMMIGTHAYAQNLVENSSFELGNAPWESVGDTMERHHQSILKVTPVDGEYYAELANSKGYKLFQTIPVEPGKYYEISFYAQARPRVSERESYFEFSVNENELTAKIQPVLGKWQQQKYTIKANSSSLTLSFEDTYFGKEGIGAMIDVVAVNEIQNEHMSIFNGESLEGWKVYGRPLDIEKNYWKVEDGSIVCNTIGSKDHDAVWLFYEEELTDFELTMKFQAYRESPGNSGVQVRSRFYEGGDIDGPQIDIHPPKPFRTALLYDETDGYNRWLYPSKPDHILNSEEGINDAPFYYSDDTMAWNKLHIICNGTSIKTILNGVLVTDFNGKDILDDVIHKEQKVGMKGKIGLQVHAKNELLIKFKDIQLRKLK